MIDFAKGLGTDALARVGAAAATLFYSPNLNTGEQEALDRIKQEAANNKDLANEIQRLLNRVPAPTENQTANDVTQLVIRSTRLFDPNVTPETEKEVVPSDDPDWEEFKRRILNPAEPATTAAPTTPTPTTTVS